MLNKVRDFIEKHRLLSPDRRYIVAVSGGADSVALFRAMLVLGYPIEAAHCNFHLRGEESDRDEAFVRELCSRHNVTLHLAHFDTQTYAELHHVSIEMAARELRYRYFEQLRCDIEAEAVCVAHHCDDSVETFLMNILRGTGIHGVTGIKPVNGTIIRPLLCVSRNEIEQWLQEIQQPYVTDSSNLVDDVLRNKIRLDVLPLLKQVCPSAVGNLLSTMELLSEAERVYNACFGKEKDEIIKNNTLVISELKKTASPLSLLFEWLHNYGFSSSSIRQIAAHLDAQSGRKWSSSTHDLYVDRDQLTLLPHQKSIASMKIPETGIYVLEDGAKLQVSRSNDVRIQRSKDYACLDASVVQFPLCIRPVAQGDRFIPFGMKGSKLVSDYLTDEKIAVADRQRQLVVCDAQGHLLWLVGQRPAMPYCVTSSTKEMLILHYLEKNT